MSSPWREYWTAPGVDSKARKDYYDKLKKQQNEESSRGDQPASAHIIVALPEDARLFIDDEATTSKSDRRVFVSPPLPAGREYYYTLRAEVVRDDKLVSFSQKVVIRAGKIAEVQLTEPSRSPGQKHLQFLAAQIVTSRAMPSMALSTTQLLTAKLLQDAFTLSGSQVASR
jgi:uncharacterized protein (TIGR03000 family)